MINWDQAHHWANYAAMDEAGQWYWFAGKLHLIDAGTGNKNDQVWDLSRQSKPFNCGYMIKSFWKYSVVVRPGKHKTRYDDHVWLQLCCAVIQNPSHQIGNGEFAVSSANKLYDEIQRRKEEE